MSIPFYLQYYVENDRNNKYQWLVYGLVIISLLMYGILLHWVPIYLRRKENTSKHKKRYFGFVRLWEIFNTDFEIRIPLMGAIYIQPSLLLVYMIYLAIMGVFSVVQTKDLDYQPQNYIVAKRISKVSMANLPLLYILVIKNDLVTSITGLKHDKLVLLHKWFSRTFFIMIVIHIILASKYWLDLGFPIMLVIPPQIFGYIAFGSFFFLNFGSLKFIRRWAYDFFLIQHRVFSFIMLLFVFFHNRKNTELAVILAVHQLVIDRILSRILGAIHTRMSPTKGMSSFEVLDEDTMLVTVPIKAFPFKDRKWYFFFLPKLNTWKAGQHVYLTVGKISRMQQHPFTISSLSDSGEMKFVIRVQKGFTKKLMKKIIKMQEEKEKKEEANSMNPSDSSEISVNVETELLASPRKPKNKFCQENSSESENDIEDLEKNDDDKIELKASFVGPIGAQYQPLITFDSAIFFSAGSGASFTFPVCLDLLNTIQDRNSSQDYLNRIPEPIIKIVWTIRKVANVKWYEFIWDKLAQYCISGQLEINIYVTQDPNMDLEKTGDVIVAEGSSSSEFQPHSSIEKNEDGNTYSTDNTYSSSLISVPNIIFHKSRPDTAGIISTHVSYLKQRAGFGSLAVLSCGPHNFNHTIKAECQRQRWDVDAPDIYCYTESF